MVPKPTRFRHTLLILLLLLLLAALPLSASAAGTGTITAPADHVDEGSTLQLSTNMSGTVTWTSSSTGLATVSSTGLVTGIQAGQVTITASCTGYTDATFTLWVTVPDGVYYIKNSSSGHCMQTTEETTYVYTQNTSQDGRINQLWKIAYISNGNYVIRPLRDFSVAMTVSSSCYVAVANAPANDSSVPSSMYWNIVYTNYGYAFKYGGSDAKTAMPTVNGPTGVPVYPSSWTSSATCHWNLQEAFGVFLRDTTTLQTVTAANIKSIEQGQTTAYSSLGMSIETYGTRSYRSWTSSDTSVAVVNTTGSVTGANPGRTVITYSATISGAEYSSSYTLAVFAPLSGYELDFEPEIWNEVAVTSPYYYVYHYTNCYAYILNNQIDPVGNEFGCNSTYHFDGSHKQQPGEFYNSNLTAGETYFPINGYTSNPSLLASAVEKDFQKYNQIFGTNHIFVHLTSIDSACPDGTYKVALYINPTSGDYHWYRQNSDGTWSHKMGIEMVKMVDDSSSPQIIYDPDVAASTAGYTVFAGYYALSSWDNFYSTTSPVSAYFTAESLPLQSINTIPPALIEHIYIGMNMDQAIDILGCPIADVGSGIVVHKYALNNGDALFVSYQTNCNGIPYISHFYTTEVANGQ